MPEAPEEPDPMEQYYGFGTHAVAKIIFGSDFRGQGVLYSAVGDVPYCIEFTGTGIRSTNMITGKFSGTKGLRGVMIPQSEAELLINYRAKDYTPPSANGQPRADSSNDVRLDSDSTTTA
jgi:hypothetical protein